MRKWFYVLELTGDHFYVGISDNFVRRHRQHVNGKGAVWTKLHEPIRVLFQHQHEVADYRAAELLENEITVRMMLEHGWQKVRGGFFCALDDKEVEAQLRSHGHWDRVLQSTLAPAQPPLVALTQAAWWGKVDVVWRDSIRPTPARSSGNSDGNHPPRKPWLRQRGPPSGWHGRKR